METNPFFISDIDGTIYRNRSITTDELLFLKKIQQKYELVFATGRNYYMFKNVVDKYNLKYNYCILNNGALIFDQDNILLLNLNFKTEKIIDYILELLSNIEGNASITFSYLMDNYYYENLSKKDLDKIIYIPESVNSISLELSSVEDNLVLTKIFNQNVENESLTCSINGRFIDVSPKESRKDKSIVFLANLKNKDIKSSIIVGDDLNDLEMLELSNFSYCLASGNPFLHKMGHTTIESLNCIDYHRLGRTYE